MTPATFRVGDPSPRLRSGLPVVTTAAAFAAAVVVFACAGGPPLWTLTRFGRPLLPPDVDGPGGDATAAAATGDNIGGAVPPPWGTRPTVAGGDTRCYLVGPTMDSPHGIARPRASPMETVKRLWANGSRAYCVTGPVCLSPAAAVADGSATAAAKLTLFSPSISCHSVDAAGRPVRPARVPPPPPSSSTAFADFDDGGAGTADDDDDVEASDGGGWMDPLADAGACADFRARYVWRKYVGQAGSVTTAAAIDAAAWAPIFSSTGRSPPPSDSIPRSPSARWHDGLTVLAPPYAHAESNLFHWLRSWVMVSHALHHLSQYVHTETAAASAAAAAVRAVAVVAGAATTDETPTAVAGIDTAAATGVPNGDDDDGRPFPTAAIFFIAHAVFHSPWNRGVMRASLAAVAAGGGPRIIRVANAHPAPSGGVECFRRAILPGVDGANTDAHAWGSDAPVVSAAVAAADAHVPAIPREALALREAVYTHVGELPQVHPADMLRLHPPAVGVVSAAAAAGLPAWPVAWTPPPVAGGSASPSHPRPWGSVWSTTSTGSPHPWATVGALFASAGTLSSRGLRTLAAAAHTSSSAGDTLRLALPRRSILVLSRVAGSKRHFDAESAAAFASIIRDTAQQRGFSLVTVTLDGLSSLESQVGHARRAGIVIGIHGANLVNSAFVPAGGALLEVIPHGYRWPGWYEAGSNTGLRYSAVSSSPTGAVPPCVAEGRQCIDNDVRDVTLRLDAGARRALRARLARAIDYLDALWAASPGGWMTVRGEGAVYRLPELTTTTGGDKAEGRQNGKDAVKGIGRARGEAETWVGLAGAATDDGREIPHE